MIRLTEWTACGGCAAKWGATGLEGLVSTLGDQRAVRDLLVGLAPFDDAAVYKVGENVALVSTTDFFPPLVDDPVDFGAIAAANACSDVFAMGGEVRLALNIAAFPEEMPTDVISAIFASAARVVEEAGGIVAGGHTIRSPEPIFGLAVQGVVHPSEVFTKGGAQPSDRLLISKPLGTGIALASGDDAAIKHATEGMRVLNRSASMALRAIREHVHAVTDVTGFGLAGHAWEIADRSGATIEIDASSLPLYNGALDAARAGVRTGGDARNRAHLEGRITSAPDDAALALVCDPQTSGGLLACVHPDGVEPLLAAGFTEIGAVVAGPPSIVIR